jgi:hypothetical protein
LEPEVVTPNAAKALGRRAKKATVERRNFMRRKAKKSSQCFSAYLSYALDCCEGNLDWDQWYSVRRPTENAKMKKPAARGHTT